MPPKSPPGKPGSLDRKAWIAAALDTLAARGIEDVRVEVLARELGVTKGSFYHHFRNRDDLHAGLLDEWRRRMVGEVIAELEAVSDPRERFRRLLRLPAIDQRADLDVELAVRLWARRDATVRAALAEVDAQRIAFIAGVLIACGVRPELARARAILVFAQLRAASDMGDEDTLRQCEDLLLS